MLALLGLPEIFLIFVVLLAMALMAATAALLFVWLLRRNEAKSGPPAPGPAESPSVPGTARICPRCGAPLPTNSPQGLCPRCVLGVGLATQTEVPGEAGPQGTQVRKPIPSPEEIAKLFPQLEILECLGRGGMGVVYKARQPKLNRLVALKILAPEKNADPKFAERFQREALTLAKLSHPNIVAIHDFGEAEGMFFLLMEFVDGVSLRQTMREGRMKPEAALAIVPKICEALQFAHEQGVVHRDIKPENVLLDKQGRVKIADFGIAKIISPLTRPAATLSPSDGERDGVRGESLTRSQVLGTPHYMAPEQVEQPELVDHRADIYSLGVVFYELLTGELPLGKFQPPSKKVQVDVRLDEVVLHALEKEPARRYQHASEVQSDVETIVRAPTAPLASHEAAAPPPPAPMPNRWEAALIAAGLTIFIGLLVTLPGLSPQFRPMLAVLAIIGLSICILTLAGWWPAPSFLIPDSGFSGRNLPSRRRSRTVLATGSDPANAELSATERARICREVRGPAVGLLVTGILNWMLIPLVAVLPFLGLPLEWKPEGFHLSNTAMHAACLASLALCSFIIYAALKMMRLKSHGSAIAASLAAILVTPGNLIGLPLGIWALLRLARADVRAAFRKSFGERWDVPTWGAFVVLGVLGVYTIQLGEQLFAPRGDSRRLQMNASGSAALTQQGWQLWQGGRPADAVPKFEAAVKLDPANTAAWNGLGWARFNSGKWAEAEPAFRRVLELESDHPAALNGLGQLFLARKNYADAETYLLQAAPKAPAAWYGLARLYLLQGKFELAEKWAQNLVDSGQGDETARLMLQAAKDRKLNEGLRFMLEPQGAD